MHLILLKYAKICNTIVVKYTMKKVIKYKMNLSIVSKPSLCEGEAF